MTDKPKCPECGGTDEILCPAFIDDGLNVCVGPADGYDCHPDAEENMEGPCTIPCLPCAPGDEGGGGDVPRFVEIQLDHAIKIDGQLVCIHKWDESFEVPGSITGQRYSLMRLDEDRREWVPLCSIADLERALTRERKRWGELRVFVKGGGNWNRDWSDVYKDGHAHASQDILAEMDRWEGGDE